MPNHHFLRMVKNLFFNNTVLFMVFLIFISVLFVRMVNFYNLLELSSLRNKKIQQPSNLLMLDNQEHRLFIHIVHLSSLVLEGQIFLLPQFCSSNQDSRINLLIHDRCHKKQKLDYRQQLSHSNFCQVIPVCHIFVKYVDKWQSIK
jgi:hypothetical protein